MLATPSTERERERERETVGYGKVFLKHVYAETVWMSVIAGLSGCEEYFPQLQDSDRDNH